VEEEYAYVHSKILKQLGEELLYSVVYVVSVNKRELLDNHSFVHCYKIDIKPVDLLTYSS
jgi:hypothetical protein